MNFENLQIGALYTAVGTLFAGTSVAVVNGLFGRRGETHKATMETVKWLQEDNKIARAREREAMEQRDEARETIAELRANISVHHDVIRVARMELSGVIYRDDLNECREELVKIRDKLDTRIR